MPVTAFDACPHWPQPISSRQINSMLLVLLPGVAAFGLQWDGNVACVAAGIRHCPHHSMALHFSSLLLQLLQCMVSTSAHEHIHPNAILSGMQSAPRHHVWVASHWVTSGMACPEQAGALKLRSATTNLCIAVLQPSVCPLCRPCHLGRTMAASGRRVQMCMCVG